jgi:hypothetical protein
MTDDAGKEGTWVTGIIGEPFQIDAEGKPIPNPPSEQPNESPSPTDIWDAGDKGLHGGAGGDLLPPGILPDRSEEIGGPDDETQKDIWERMDRGEFGPGAGSTPENAETAN